MTCTNCGNDIESGAVYCGNCGQPVSSQEVHAVKPASPNTVQNPAPPVPTEPNPANVPPELGGLQPITPQVQQPFPQQIPQQVSGATQNQAPIAPFTPGSGPAYGGIEQFTRPGGGKAIAALVLGVVGLLAWLVPIVGLVVGVLALVFGTMSTKSGHRKLAIIGIVLGSVGIALSLFLFTYGVQKLSKKAAVSTSSQSVSSSTTAGAYGVTTPCFNTKTTVNLTPGSNSCSLEGTVTGSETQFIKAIVSQSVSSDAALPSIAKQDVTNVLTALPGAYIDSESSARFASSTAYTFRIKSSQDSGSATITYVRHPGPIEYNVYIIGRFVNSGDSSLSNIESSWSWK